MRTPVSAKQNRFFNGEAIDDSDLLLEQNYNNSIQTSILNNHVGNGVLLEHLNPQPLFNSDEVSDLLDGKAIDVQVQPSDANYGNQLEMELTGSNVNGKRTIKVFLIGLDFQNNLQYSRIIFHKNEKQILDKHYTKILKLFFNDFVGDNDRSLNLGGRLTIKEVSPFSLSRDCLMVSQDVEPNIFIRDFVTDADNQTLQNLLVTSLPSYNIDNLLLTSDYKQLRSLSENDVSSQIGQKFLATNNNIQKISLLLGISNSIDSSDLEWTGDLIISIFQLQSALDCPLDIAPGTAIDFDPSNIPLAQLSFNYATFLSQGILLGETPQPVDFIFSSTPVGNGTIIKSGSYYVVTLKRAGSADKCAIQIAVGTDRTENSKETLFNGSIWVDVNDEDLWFQVWTDSAKVSDGQAYDAGHGMVIPKTIISGASGLTIDYSLEDLPFVRNDVYYGIAEAETVFSGVTQDPRTGSNVLAQQQFVPQISLITASDLISREVASDPLILGNIADKNAKSISSGTSEVTSKFHEFSIIGNQCIVKVIDDPTDGYRYDPSIINLITELSGGNGISNINALLNGKFTPNYLDTGTFYRVSDTEIISMLYGDLNGDGVVDAQDLIEVQSLIDSDLNQIPSQADYITLTTLFQSDTYQSWNLLDDDGVTILQSGIDGMLTTNPQDGTRAIFASISGAFNSVSSLSTKKIVIYSNSDNPGNNGSFAITGLVDNFTLDIQKKYFTSNTILKIFQADINGDMVVDSSDEALIDDYINKAAPFPNSSSPANRIGTEFTAIRFTLEQYIDRADDYTANVDRLDDLHPIHDILLDGYNAGFPLFGTVLKNFPVTFKVAKQLVWQDYLVSATTNPKLVPVSFNYQSGFTKNDCALSGVTSDHYPLAPEFDPGRTDIFFPNNLVVNYGGELLRPDGYYYPIDFEIGNIIFEVPAADFTSEKTINIFTDCIANYNDDGTTRIGMKAFRFADCSFVSLDALTKEQVRFSVSVRSFSPDKDSSDVIDKMGISLDESSGLLTLNFADLYEDPILQTLKTRIQITTYLKKAGFKNQDNLVNSTMSKNLLGL